MGRESTHVGAKIGTNHSESDTQTKMNLTERVLLSEPVGGGGGKMHLFADRAFLTIPRGKYRGKSRFLDMNRWAGYRIFERNPQLYKHAVLESWRDLFFP